MRRILMVLLMITGFMVASVPQARAATPACGAVLVADTTFTSDLFCPATAGGLRVGADGITIDMAGFTLSGDFDLLSGVGIFVVGYDEVTITNGTVRGFQDGVAYEDTDLGRVENMRLVRNNRFGLNLSESRELTITSSTIRRNGEGEPLGGGMLATLSNTTRVSDTRFVRNTGPGVWIQLSEEMNFSDSTFRSNELGAKLDDVVDIRWAGNRFSRNDKGMRLDGASGQIVEDNRFTANGVGIEVIDPQFNPGNHSIVNRFDGNTFARNVSMGMLLLDPLAANVTISNNTARQNGSIGFLHMGGEATYTDNRAVRNGGSGFAVGDGVATMGGNVSNRNGQWGFNIVPPGTVIDLGGNSANGNTAGDCTPGIAC